MKKLTQGEVRRKPRMTRREPPKDQVLAMTVTDAKKLLPMRIPGDFGLDVIVQELGGPMEFLKYCRLSGNSKIQGMVRTAESLPENLRKDLSFQEMCDRMMIDAVDVLTDIVVNLYRYHGSMAKIMNALAVKEVMKTSIEVAKTVDGFSDRKMQLEMAGLVKKGPMVNVNVGVGGVGVEGMIEEMDDAIDVQPINN